MILGILWVLLWGFMSVIIISIVMVLWISTHHPSAFRFVEWFMESWFIKKFIMS